MSQDNEFEPQAENTAVEPLAEPPVDVSADVPVEDAGTPPEPFARVETERKVQSGMFGTPELIALGVSCLALFGILIFYFLVLVPAENDLKFRKAQRDQQELKLAELKKKYDRSTKTETIVANLEQSVTDFESRYLPIFSIGQTALIDRVNGLMAAYRLRNTAGPEYSPLGLAEQQADGQEERGKTKFQSLFPGEYINMTVEGSYVNLRRFISEIEASQQFIVISTVELEAAENVQQRTQNITAGGVQVDSVDGFAAASGKGGIPTQQQPAQPAGPRGKTSGEIVSLHLEFAAYFRREAAANRAGNDNTGAEVGKR